jgi:N-acetylglucosaminyl-diphospho-decaprenol L-rhamnosyltransferase
MPDVSVLVVAYNGVELLRTTLQSLIQSTHDIAYEIIVIDNASLDRSIEMVAQEFPQAHVIFRQQNHGYAAAINDAANQSKGRYLLLLNPDTLLYTDALSRMVGWMDRYPEVGVTGPQLLQSDGKPQPYSYGFAPTPLYLLRRQWSHLRGRYLHAWRGTKPQDVEWVAGTCLLVRREAWNAVGGMDPRFFLYFEDVDFGMRLRQAGWRVIFLPMIAVTHIGGGSVGRQARRFYDRSFVLFYRKHYGTVAGFAIWLALRVYRTLQRFVPDIRGSAA